ncbi:flagellin [Limnobacter sp. 130]|jgi:flagellin|uniref:flagellin N-terminal helical domain-containing protein n=1 Tax=Limnobacter sp. 130 TaxID=2653147 RepID=UPI0012F18CCD|nr:flagellin [Limnobacter sp. 130]VWX35524.1 Flagellin [Limnobacter sp. 130]
MLGINTNVASLTAQKNLSGSGMGLNNAIARLSSGLRVNSAKDDAAGLAIAERMQAQIKGYDVAARNANDGISLLQVADGAMGKISDNLQRMRELAVQAKNGTLNDTDRVNLNREYAELANEVDRIVTGSTFNGNNMFDAANKTLSFQVGTGNAVSDTLALNLTDDGLAAGNDLTTIMTNGAASIQANLNGVDTVANATTAITTLDASIDAITGIRAVVGAGQSRLEQVASFADLSSTNLQAARGRIMDADFAKETAALTRSQILQQAGTAMLAQANQLPNNVLSLLQ